MNGLHSVLLSQQRFTTTHRLAQTLLTTCLLTCISLPGFTQQNSADAPDNRPSEVAPKTTQEVHDAFVQSVRTRKLTVDQTLKELGLETPRSCLDFADPQAVKARKKHWSYALTVLNQTHHNELIGWIIGQTRPPLTASRESELQKNCLLTALINDITQSDHKIRAVLNFAYSFDGEINGPRQLAALFTQSPGRRREIFNKITQSGYRNAGSQSQIWVRKYRFEGRSFNAVSEDAAERCDLPGSQTWKPDHTSHKNCWYNNLSSEEREREILQASSAPGISRHHWATDFDLFSLNTTNFIPNAPHHGDYLWMQDNALRFGYFQPYQGIASDSGRSGYMEERWHWSYLPIAQSLFDFVTKHQTRVETALFEQWDEIEARSSRGRREPNTFFPFVRANWRAYMFNVDAPHQPQKPDPKTAEAPHQH